MRFLREFLGEFTGTFFLVLFGTGQVAVSFCFDEYSGIFQAGIVWGIGLALSIYATRNICCAHFNPAVTLTMAICKRCSWRKVPVYMISQFLGAFSGSMAVYGLFHSNIAKTEAVLGIVRGSEMSYQSAKMFGEYYAFSGISMWQAFLAEAAGTFILVFMIFALTDSCNVGRPDDKLTPLFIGLTLSACIVLIAPLTQAGLNPARDFSPRIVALMFGWGRAAFPDASGGAFIVYMLAPLVGAVIAGLLYTKVFERIMNKKTDNCCK